MGRVEHLSEGVTLYLGDCLDVLPTLGKFDAVVTDFHMPYLNGLDLLAQSRVIWSDTPVIIVSKAQWDMSEMAEENGVFAWIRKSSSPGVLLSILAMAVEQSVEQGVEWGSHQAMERVGV